ncbi:helix-turn-helix transcriptional regulator [Aquimarina pacifica]|uniref:helix-turn-helix transcriptional regulator n=1 Tax=Aquimarina pacifica TaxID=1296415 RepID=UPI000470E972|nr:AraC family transcriptional regulator [Aquimarina pacifica]
MDKKRRKKTSLKTEVYTAKIDTLQEVIELTGVKEHCGIISKRYKFLESYGIGFFLHHQFEGLSIAIFDVLLKKDILLQGNLPKDFLELSFLIDGELIIKIEGISKDFIYESQESYLVYLSEIRGSISYHKRKRLKEVKIRMTKDFIERHHLNDEFNILETFCLTKQEHNFLKPLCAKTQNILSEILSDTRRGLLKRLFLESKTLELISLQLEKPTKAKPNISIPVDNLIKKLYQTQHIISSDLSIQYSIQQLSKEIGLNDFVLKKEFKKLFGKTIFEYAMGLRMDKAKQLLDHSKKPIYEISELVGYKNSTHFTAAFKKIQGVTPKKYRNKEVY